MASSKKLLSADWVERVFAALKREIPPASRVVVGLSGGIDSVTLLFVLHKLDLPIDLSCLHVNHKISPNAGKWASFCVDLCEKWSIPIKVEEVEVDKNSSLEEEARRARYAVFEKVEADFLCLAHHLDDQAETLVFHLFRGTGLKGTLPERRALRCLKILRPFLSVTRQSIEEFAREQELHWINDESNDNTAFSRNYIRHEILPRVEKRFPAYREALSRFSSHLSDASFLLDDLARIDGGIVDGKLSLAALRSLSLPRAGNLLRFFLNEKKLRMPSSARLNEMLRQFKNGARDAETLVVHEGFELRSFRGFVHVLPKLADIPAQACFPWNGEEVLPILDMGVIRFEKMQGCGMDEKMLSRLPVTVRFRRGGEHFRPSGKRPSRELKNLFQESAIPPWQRNRLPLLYCGEDLVWVPGIGVAFEYQAEPRKMGVRVSWEAQFAATAA